MADSIHPPILQTVQSTVLRCTRVLARIMRLDVEITDHQLERIAITSEASFVPGFPQCQVRKTALASRQSITVRNPLFDPHCKHCKRAANCPNQALMAVPIVLNDDCAGLVTLMCHTPEQRTRLLHNSGNYREYTENTVRLYLEQIQQQHSDQQPRNWATIIDNIAAPLEQAILLTDSRGSLVYINDAARRQLALPVRAAVSAITVRPFGVCNSTGKPETHYVIAFSDDRGNADEKIIPGVQTPLGEYRMLSLALERRQPGSSQASEHNQLIGKSSVIQELRKRVRRVADSPSSVMLRGESGTGKEVFARAIHQASARADKPFVAINCAAIPEQLLESELFGYVKGAFTGANTRGSEGLIRQASGGTLFLDEIGDMTMHLQAKLLRVLDRREVTPVGSSKTIAVDIRVISATHRDFESLIGKGEFREDLFYRLNVVPLELPPLREREGDIDLLIDYFLGHHCRALARHRPALTPDTLACLRHWHWPGNIRELSNMIEYLVNVADPTLPVTPNLLPERMRIQPPASVVAPASVVTPATCDSGLLNIESMEKQLIEQALNRFSDQHDGKQLAARALGIGIATLYRKIKKYELEVKIS